MTDMLHCPKGHELPHKASKGHCTPLYCAAGKAKKADSPFDTSAPAFIAVSPQKAPDTEEGKLELVRKDEKTRAKSQLAKRQVRAELTEQPPKNVDGEAAEAWAASKLVRMLPDAVTELEFQLLFGDDKQRMEAARDVLDANGMRKREAMASGGQTIVLNVSGPLPWQITAPMAPKTVEGSVSAQKQLGEDAGAEASPVSEG